MLINWSQVTSSGRFQHLTIKSFSCRFVLVNGEACGWTITQTICKICLVTKRSIEASAALAQCYGCVSTEFITNRFENVAILKWKRKWTSLINCAYWFLTFKSFKKKKKRCNFNQIKRNQSSPVSKWQIAQPFDIDLTKIGQNGLLKLTLSKLANIPHLFDWFGKKKRCNFNQMKWNQLKQVSKWQIAQPFDIDSTKIGQNGLLKLTLVDWRWSERDFVWWISINRLTDRSKWALSARANIVNRADWSRCQNDKLPGYYFMIWIKRWLMYLVTITNKSAPTSWPISNNYRLLGS